MSDEPRPRTWLPIALAAGIAALVIVGALVVTVLSQRLSPVESEAARACEDAFAASGSSAAITAGDIYVAADWRELEAFLEEQGLVTDAPDAEALDAAVATLGDQGRDLVEVVWFLSDDTHLACTVELSDGTAEEESLVLGEPARLPLAVEG